MATVTASMDIIEEVSDLADALASIAKGRLASSLAIACGSLGYSKGDVECLTARLTSVSSKEKKPVVKKPKVKKPAGVDGVNKILRDLQVETSDDAIIRAAAAMRGDISFVALPTENTRATLTRFAAASSALTMLSGSAVVSIAVVAQKFRNENAVLSEQEFAQVWADTGYPRAWNTMLKYIAVARLINAYPRVQFYSNPMQFLDHIKDFRTIFARDSAYWSRLPAGVTIGVGGMIECRISTQAPAIRADEELSIRADEDSAASEDDDMGEGSNDQDQDPDASEF